MGSAVDTASYPARLGERELAGPWRRAALVAVGIAALELLALIVVVAALTGRTLLHSASSHATGPAHATARARAHAAAPAHPVAPARPRTPALPPARTRVLVLNGNGVNGAAHAEAATLAGHGYRIAATGNAQRNDYAATLVMFRPGYDREARRLAHAAGIAAVAPLDGLPPRSLHGAQLVVITGR